jgi:hypothetical protein
MAFVPARLCGSNALAILPAQLHTERKEQFQILGLFEPVPHYSF